MKTIKIFSIAMLFMASFNASIIFQDEIPLLLEWILQLPLIISLLTYVQDNISSQA